MQSYVIHFIRHGLTEGNLQGRYVGRTDLPLAPAGRAQLEKQRRAGGYPAAQAYFCAPQLRCRETLEVLYPQARPALVDGFSECDFGAWEGKTAREIAQADPHFMEWMNGGPQAGPAGGESNQAFMYRVCAAFEALVEQLLRTQTVSAVVVASGGVIMSLLVAYGLPRAQAYEWMMDAGCGYSVRITPGLWMRSMVAEVYAQLPPREDPAENGGILNLAREAAARSYGGRDEEASRQEP